MSEIENTFNWRLSPKIQKRSTDASLSHISKSVLHDIVESPQFKSLPPPDQFIPFHQERDGLNRLIKSNSQKFSKIPKKRNQSLNNNKKLLPSKKVLLRNPLASQTPAVGTYSSNSDWTKPSFNKGSPKKLVFRSNQSPSEVSRSFDKVDQVNRIFNKEKLGKSREFSYIERRMNHLPRKKGIWEDIKIQELPRGLVFKSVEESSNIVSAYHSSIVTSMQKFKQEMMSIQKYLK